MTSNSVRKALSVATFGVFAAASFAMAQDSSTTAGGWKRVGDDAQVQGTASTSQSNPNATNPYPDSSYPQQQTAQAPSYPPPAGDAQAQNYPPPPQSQPMQPSPQQAPQQQYPQNQQYPMQNPPAVPSQIMVPAGTYITVRVNQQLSSDHNQPGDAFSATLVRPLVANGVVVAEPGQTVGGRVAQVQKAGRVEGLSKLGVELTDLALVDGQQLPVKTTLVSRTGNSSVGRDVGGVAATTGLGAAVGAAADWGRGAAIGAGAGAAVGIIGVLVTRGQPSVIYPEQVLTFRIEQPLTVSTDRSPQAFRYVQPGEYTQAGYAPSPGPGPAYGSNYAYGAPGPGYLAAPNPYPYYGAYPYYGYSYYPYGGFSLFVGRGWGRGYYYGGGRYGGFGGGRYGGFGGGRGYRR
jgi:hypothetical protein